MKSSARPYTRTCVSTSTEPSMSLTPRLSAQHSTKRTVNINGRATETTRFGHQSLEHVRTTPTMSARTWPRPRPSRLPTLCAMMCQSSCARMCQDKFVFRSLTRCAETSPLNSVPRSQDRSALLNTRRSPSEWARECQRRSAMKDTDQTLDCPKLLILEKISLPTRPSLIIKKLFLVIKIF